MSYADQILTVVKRRKTGVTAGELQAYLGFSRKTISSTLSRYFTSGTLATNGKTRRSPLTGKTQQVYIWSTVPAYNSYIG